MSLIMIEPLTTFLSVLWYFTSATCIAMVVVACLRLVVRRVCGAAAVLWLWWIVPISIGSLLMPKTVSVIQSTQATSVPNAITQSFVETMPPAAIPWQETVFAIWLAVALVIAVRLFVVQSRFSRGVIWNQNRRGSLPSGSGPAVIGAFAPRLALPIDFRARYNAQERKLILLHEHIHLRRRDGLANFAMATLLVLQWFNPLVHWAVRAMCRDQERACDALVITRHPNALRAYADALLKTLSESLPHLPLVSRWQAYHPTVERIAMLKEHRDIRSKFKLGVAMLVGGASLASAVAYAVRPANVVVSQINPTKIAATSLTPPTPEDVQASVFYRVKVVLTRPTPEAVATATVFKKKSEFVIIVREGERVVIEQQPDIRLTLTAKPNAEKVRLALTIESITSQKILSSPVMVVKPGAVGTIEMGSPQDGGELGGIRLEVTASPLTTEEASALPKRAAG
jgi:beta-lactamase regulating signal transducer with metallopeptidase domain